MKTVVVVKNNRRSLDDLYYEGELFYLTDTILVDGNQYRHKGGDKGIFSNWKDTCRKSLWSYYTGL